ncbi:hypothetical protein JZO70_08745 [Enterococcus sp. 669A]|uniref:Lipoprotein n=1 Tax=Candidatus Enterococcus moelleringii TaxID=2815325 RepID=A0ABS3L9H3_9ENTE|nr:hypothetical protein [Enterococcus sp. 669A]MBO1306245.1 hypothetical protein [Enterococcus sp. 669A]
MKKWIVLAIMLGILSGCGFSSGNENAGSEKAAESTSEKKYELKAADFEIDGTNYRISLLDSWTASTGETSFRAYDDQDNNKLSIYGMKKEDDFEFDTFKFILKEQVSLDIDFQLAEDSIEETAYQTAHYSGELYSFSGTSEGEPLEVRRYFLETDTDYVAIMLMESPAVFDKNAALYTEIIESFVAE